MNMLPGNCVRTCKHKTKKDKPATSPATQITEVYKSIIKLRQSELPNPIDGSPESVVISLANNAMQKQIPIMIHASQSYLRVYVTMPCFNNELQDCCATSDSHLHGALLTVYYGNI
jgi:hypothetical protein